MHPQFNPATMLLDEDGCPYHAHTCTCGADWCCLVDPSDPDDPGAGLCPSCTYYLYGRRAPPVSAAMVIHFHVCRCGVAFECVHDRSSSYPLICGDCADAEYDTGRWPFACPDCGGGDPEVGVACADCARYDFRIERLRENGLA